MAKRDDYRAGAPCWVDTWQPDPRAAREFYGALLGWSFDSPDPDGARGRILHRPPDRTSRGRDRAGPSELTGGLEHVCRRPGRRVVAGRCGGSRRHTARRPLSVGSDGRIVADTTGVPFGLWQATGRIAAERVGEPGGWAMSSLHTRDVEQARVFYGSIFGWELEWVRHVPFAQWRARRRALRRRRWHGRHRGSAALERQLRRRRCRRHCRAHHRVGRCGAHASVRHAGLARRAHR